MAKRKSASYRRPLPRSLVLATGTALLVIIAAVLIISVGPSITDLSGARERPPEDAVSGLTDDLTAGKRIELAPPLRTVFSPGDTFEVTLGLINHLTAEREFSIDVRQASGPEGGASLQYQKEAGSLNPGEQGALQHRVQRGPAGPGGLLRVRRLGLHLPALLSGVPRHLRIRQHPLQGQGVGLMQVGAVFGLIFALIVMGLFLVFGSGQMANIMCLGNVGQTSKAVKSLESLVDDIQASGEGSTDTFSLGIPSNAEVCFIDPSDPRHHAAGGWMPDMDLYPIIEEQIQAGGYNVWIRYNCGDADPGYVMEHVTLPPAREGQPNSNFCAGSRDTLLLTNVGVEVRIERLA